MFFYYNAPPPILYECFPYSKTLIQVDLVGFFLKPKIKTSEIIKFLNKKELIFIEYKALNRKEKQRNVFNQKKELTFDKIFSTKSEYKIIGFSQDENKYKIYWAEIKSWHRLFGKPNVNFIEGKDSKLLNELQKELTNATLEGRQNEASVKAQREEFEKLFTAITNAEQEFGNFRRQVGNYEKASEGALRATEKLL